MKQGAPGLALLAIGLGLATDPVSARGFAGSSDAGSGKVIWVAPSGGSSSAGLLAEGVRRSVISQLEQSPFFTLVADKKLETAFLDSPTDPGVSVASCRRLGASVIIGSAASQTSDGNRIELSATGCATGKRLARIVTHARSRKDIVERIARAVARIRERLGEPIGSIHQFGSPAALGTTSIDALGYYARGLNIRQARGDTDAVAQFEQAARADTQFPMPLVSLSQAARNLRQPALALDYAAKAFALRARAGARARLQIEASYDSATGNLDAEISTYRKWTAIYPGDYAAHNNLGDDLFALGKYESALHEYKVGVELAPTVAGYSNLMGAYLSLERLADARRTFDRAAALKLDGRYVRQTMYWLAFVLGEPAAMDEQVRWAAGKPGDEDVLLSLQSDTEAFHGRLAKARQLTKKAVASAVSASVPEAAGLWQVNGALREAELGNAALAVQDVQSALRLSRGRDVALFAALALARAGSVDEAELLLAELKRTYARDAMMRRYWFPTIGGAIALCRGRNSEALRDLKEAEQYELGGAGTTINYLYPAYIRGLAHLASGDPKAAQREFEKLVSHPGIVINFITGALARLQLARAFAREGEVARANNYCRQFLALWNDADPDLRKRLMAPTSQDEPGGPKGVGSSTMLMDANKLAREPPLGPCEVVR